MIRIHRGDILDAYAEALVNTVNCRGAMGAGLAKQVAERFPESSQRYKAACAVKTIRPGRPFVTKSYSDAPMRWIIHLPTKDDWRFKSRMVWIEEGLFGLRELIPALGISSIAIPPIGCGKGGLHWPDVEERLYHHLDGLDCIVQLYLPVR